jgi:hypothetical protein
VICEAIRKTTRRVSSETDAFKEHQSGATWSIDLVTHIKVPAIDGAKYFAVGRDVRTGVFAGFGLELKSDMTAMTVKLGEAIRKKYGPDHTHLLFRTLLLDSAGEQKCPKFKQAMLDMKGGACDPSWNDPSREKSKSTAVFSTTHFVLCDAAHAHA